MEYFHFTATGEIKTCKLSRAIASETKLSYRVNYNHNRKISYTCGRKSAQKHSVCMNGKWQPEVTCTGELFFRSFPKCAFSSSLVKGASLCLKIFLLCIMTIIMKLEGNLETNQNTVPEYELYHVPWSAINTPPSSTVTLGSGCAR